MPKTNGQKIPVAAAKAYWLAMPPEKRTFQAVADRFRCDRSRISQIAKRDGWRDTLAELEVEAEATMTQELRSAIRRQARPRAERIAKVLELFDRANDLALAQLPIGDDGEIDLKALGKDSPALEKLLTAMPGLHRMAELAAGEATDRVHVSEVQPVLLAFARIALLDRDGDRERFLGMLVAASSGLVEIEGQAVRVE